MTQRDAEEFVGKVRLRLGVQQNFAACFEQLTVLDTGRTDLLTRPATQASIDMRLKCAGRVLEPSLRHGPHQIKPPAWSIVLVSGDHVGGARLEAQAAMNAGQQLVLFS